MKYLFIINPKAGRYDHTSQIIPRIHQAMKDRKDPYEVVSTRHPLHAAEIVQELHGADPVRVYICGGDGTLNEAVLGAVGADNIEIGHFPCGSGNDFIKAFGQDTAAFSNWEKQIGGRAAVIDLIGCNGRYSINICSVGFDARIAADVPAMKKLPFCGGSGAYVLSILKNLFSGISGRYQVRVDGENHDGKYAMLIACNGNYYGGGFHPVPEARVNDGILDFLLVRSMSRLRIIKIIDKYKKGLHNRYPDDMIWIRGKKMEIICDKVDKINLDGEILPAKNATLYLSSKKIRFILPEGIKLPD